MQNETNPFEPQPTQPPQPTPAVTPEPFEAPALQSFGPANVPAPTDPVQAPQKSKLALWALIVSIAALVTGVIFFVSAPLALTALILSIIALKKHASRKGMSIAALIISAFTLLIVVPIMAVITLVAYNGITERANEVRANAAANEERANLPKVSEQCYEFTLPKDYELSTTGTNCVVTLSIERNVTDKGSYTSSDVEQIKVTPLTGEVPNLKQIRESLMKTASGKNGVVSQGEVSEVNGATVYYFETKYSETAFAYYYILDPSMTFGLDEAPITGYKIVGRSDSADSLAALELIIDSFSIKK